MRLLIFLGALLLASNISAAAPANGMWSDLQSKRERLSSLHQEFDVLRITAANGTEQSSTWRLIVDMSGRQWRETSIAGFGNRIVIFDGTERFLMEEAGAEYVRTRPTGAGDALPSPYAMDGPDWTKARELERRSCAINTIEHQCVLLEAPLESTMRLGSRSQITTRTGGTARALLDLKTGMLLSSRTLSTLEGHNAGWQTELRFTLKKVSYGAPADPTLFALPHADMRQVKQLTEWNAARIRGQLAGQPSPAINWTDVTGHTISLDALRGKTVLLDFFTTWCPPCRKDAAALDKLNRKYGGGDLSIIGVSVSEDRAIVEKFLSEHPHGYPTVLTTENDMPRPYQIRVFPTYIIIGKDGTVMAATEGDKGFGELSKLLRKAGLESD